MGRARGASAGLTAPPPTIATMTNAFPVLLAVHITLALSLVLPSILLPFALRTRRATVDSKSRVVRGLLWAQSNGTIVIGAGLALTGIGLVLSLGSSMLQQPWLLLALTIYFVNLAIAFFVYLVWRERRGEIAEWSTRARTALYGAAVIMVVDITVITFRGASGLDAAAFVLVLLLCGYAMWRTWRQEHTYG